MENNIENQELNNALDALLSGAQLTTNQVDYLSSQFTVIKDFFDCQMGNSKEVELKKLVAAALIEANDKGVLSVPEGMTPEEIASRVDQSLNKSKAKYQYETGKLTDEESFEYLLDNLAANAIAIVDRFVDESTPLLTGILTAAIVAAFPEAAPLAPVVNEMVGVVVKEAIPWIKKIINVGIKSLSSFAQIAIEEFSQPIENTQTVQQKQLAEQ